MESKSTKNSKNDKEPEKNTDKTKKDPPKDTRLLSQSFRKKNIDKSDTSSVKSNKSMTLAELFDPEAVEKGSRSEPNQKSLLDYSVIDRNLPKPSSVTAMELEEQDINLNRSSFIKPMHTPAAQPSNPGVLNLNINTRNEIPAPPSNINNLNASNIPPRSAGGGGSPADQSNILPGGSPPNPPTTRQVFNKVTQYLTGSFPQSNDKEAMVTYLKHVSTDICSFCGGRGHFPNNCATKKNVDAVMRDTGNGPEWGRIKRKYKSDTYHTKRNIRRSLNED